MSCWNLRELQGLKATKDHVLCLTKLWGFSVQLMGFSKLRHTMHQTYPSGPCNVGISDVCINHLLVSFHGFGFISNGLFCFWEETTSQDSGYQFLMAPKTTHAMDSQLAGFESPDHFGFPTDIAIFHWYHWYLTVLLFHEHNILYTVVFHTHHPSFDYIWCNT